MEKDMPTFTKGCPDREWCQCPPDRCNGGLE